MQRNCVCVTVLCCFVWRIQRFWGTHKNIIIKMKAYNRYVWRILRNSSWFYSMFWLLTLIGHRTLYIGVHVPLGRRSHRRHRHHGHRHRKRSRERDSGTEDGRESPSYSKISITLRTTWWTWKCVKQTCFCLCPADTPSQRVQFLLGMEDDEEHIPHALFTELDEICLKEGEDAEWKETARYKHTSTWGDTERVTC